MMNNILKLIFWFNLAIIIINITQVKGTKQQNLITKEEKRNNLHSDPDEYRSLKTIIRSRGFDVEQHNIITEDGYYLVLYRIIDAKSRKKINYKMILNKKHYFFQYQKQIKNLKIQTRKPVILQHGLFGSAADFIINSPFLRSNNSKCGDNLAFGLHLTDQYDVWLSNSRGNRYSRGHEKFKNDDHQYWQFSFDQMAQFDTPAVIDYVRNVTSQKSVAYIGYSQVRKERKNK